MVNLKEITMGFDLLVSNGIVIDGTGLARRRADVGVTDGRVVEIGRLPGSTSARTIDAEGMIVAPGIVDAHTHYDPQVTFDPWATSSCYHGVTTVVAGNCGFSAAPARLSDHDFLRGMFASVEGISPDALDAVDWGSGGFGGFLRRRAGRLGVNMAMYVGHSTLRRWVMGDAASERTATADEVRAMEGALEEAIRAGAAGFTTSLNGNHLDGDGRPVPSRRAERSELLSLAAATGRANRGSISFVGNQTGMTAGEEDRALLLDLALQSGLPVITQGLGGRSKVDAPDTSSWEDVMGFFRDAATMGAAVFSLLRVQPMDRPFTIRNGTGLYCAVPTFHAVLAEDHAEKVAVLADVTTRDRIRAELERPNVDPAKGPTLPPPAWSSLLVNEVTEDRHRPLVGRSVAQIAQERAQDPLDTMLDLALADDLETEFLVRNDHDDWHMSVRAAQHHPNMVLGVSDGGAHLDRDDGSWWSTYFLRTRVLDHEEWTLEEGIRQITEVPAALVGIDRGRIAVGAPADMMIFDQDEIAPATKSFVTDLPHGAGRFCARPKGIVATIVNGRPIVLGNELTSELPGQVVRPAFPSALRHD